MRLPFAATMVTVAMAGAPPAMAAPPDAEVTPDRSTSAQAAASDIALLRREAVGMKLGTLKAGGTVYRNVVVSKVDDLGIKVFHQSGVAHIAFRHLDPELRERLGYDPRSADPQKGPSVRKPAPPQPAPKRTSKVRGRPPSGAEDKDEEKVDRKELEKTIVDLDAKIAKLDIGIRKAQVVAAKLEERSAKFEAESHYTVMKRDSEGRAFPIPRIDKSKSRRAAYYKRLAEAEELKIEKAEKLIAGYEAEISELRRKLRKNR